MPDACEVVVYVRSRRVATGAVEIRGLIPLVGTLSTPAYAPVRTVRLSYAVRLDEAQRRILAEGRRLAADTGRSFRIVDLGRGNPIRRALRLWRLGRPRLPVVILEGPCAWQPLVRARGPREAARA